MEAHSLVAFVDPIHANNEEEKKQNALLPEFNVYMESFDCLPFTHHETRVGTIECLNGT